MRKLNFRKESIGLGQNFELHSRKSQWSYVVCRISLEPCGYSFGTVSLATWDFPLDADLYPLVCSQWVLKIKPSLADSIHREAGQGEISYKEELGGVRP